MTVIQVQRSIKQIQDFLALQGYNLGSWGSDGVDGPATTGAVKAWQYDMFLLPDGVWGLASDGTAFPPAGTVKGVDYSFARPDIQMLVNRGIKHAGRYLYRTVQSNGLPNKGISRQEWDDLKGSGIEPWFFYEEDVTDPIKGFEVGRVQALRAEEHRDREGLPDLPIHFPVDHDAVADEIPEILKGLEGAATIVGPSRVGVYGEFDVVKAAFDAGVVQYACQTYAWSSGRWDSRATTQQWANGQWGGTVDFNRATRFSDFGQLPDSVPVRRSELKEWRATVDRWLEGR